MRIGRRELLGALAGTGLSASIAPVRLALAGSATGDAAAQAPRLVLVLLRGGVDGLSMVPAWGDPHFEAARAGVAVPAPGERDGARDLDGYFSLHPTLEKLHQRWQEGDLAVVHAHCIPYRDRSHFEAQNVLEHGGTTPYSLTTGWLNRALSALAELGQDPETLRAVAVAPAMPLALRGEAPAGSWSPSVLPSPNEDLLDRLARLYADDEGLARAFEEARLVDGLAGAPQRGGRRQDLSHLCEAAGKFLAAPEGPRVAVLESAGWDTHSAQERRGGTLYRQFTQLDAGLELLRISLGKAWARTAVLVLTEFGRTVAMNGAAGTDHGTGGAGLLLGGAVRGKRVHADWPGLSRAALHEGRDLRPTLDTRALLKGLLIEHLGVPSSRVETKVFPGSPAVKALRRLIV
ncbi:MAG: DUF1501 domain-containing protein [Pseudomonadota bacterium]